MHPVIAAVGRFASARPHRPALTDNVSSLSYRALGGAIGETAAEVRARGARTVALCLENSSAWVVADLALLAARLPCLPLPEFFSPTQHWHALTNSGADWIITDRPDFFIDLLRTYGSTAVRAPDLDLPGRRLAQLEVGLADLPRLPDGTAKVTYTSGTTGHPKGVCLDGSVLGVVAQSLAATCGLTSTDRHLSLLPLATLLENVGVYATLLAGGCCVLPSLQQVGTAGASGVQPDRMLARFRASRATTAITVPQILRALVGQLERGETPPPALRFLAVGGATVATAVLENAEALGLPVYEGYGLSECASVLTLNHPGAHRRGSVGRPLPHVTLSFADDGEILAQGAALIGYCGTGESARRPWPTGDIGHLDRDGFLHLEGRKKDFFVTSYGRNVSPEWIEAALSGEPEIAQAWVSGEARPWVAAVLTPENGTTDAAVNTAIDRVNEALPHYARVRQWIRSQEPFSVSRGELTGYGRLRRQVLRCRYGPQIESLYEERTHELL